MAGRRIAVVSDLHCNSIVAPWPADQPLEGGGRYEPNNVQLWLNERWADAVRRMGHLDILILNGDIIQGINPKDSQTVTVNRHVEAEAAIRLLSPLVKKAKKTYYIRGTEWHEGRSSENVEALARELGCEQNEAGQYTRWEMFLHTDGGVIHCEHGIGVAGVPTTEATVPWRDTVNMIGELHRAYGSQAPDVKMIVRSHRHRAIHIDAPPQLHATVTPAWQMKTAFVHKRGGVMLPQIGYVLIGDAGGRLKVDIQTYPLPAPKVEGIA